MNIEDIISEGLMVHYPNISLEEKEKIKKYFRKSWFRI